MAIDDGTLTETSYLMTHTVGLGQNGIRLDHFLMDRYRKRSRGTIQRAIEEGVITLERPFAPHLTVGRLKSSTQLMSGDQILVLSEKKPEPEVSFDYKVLYEDAGLLIIDKPPNLPVHPAGRYFFNTLLIHLKTHGHKNPLHMERDYFLVHRIDKETSGILVLAKDRNIVQNLTEQFAQRQTEKTYWAIVRGICPEEFTIDLAMARAQRSLVELKMVPTPVEQGGMTALTRFKRLDTASSSAGDFSLVECYPKTGRQHQIRVHLDAAGHPIVGDKLYGLPESEAFKFYERHRLTAENWAQLLMPRHALHSCGISFTHPKTGLKVSFNTEMPSDFTEFFEGAKIGKLPR